MFLLLLIFFFLTGCQSEEIYAVRGCGFSLSIPKSYHLKINDTNMDALGYVVYDENQQTKFTIGALNAPTTLNYFDLEENPLTKEFKLKGKFFDKYNEMGLGDNIVTLIYGSNVNEFPLYIRVMYSTDVVDSNEIEKILATLSVEKELSSSEYCR